MKSARCLSDVRIIAALFAMLTFFGCGHAADKRSSQAAEKEIEDFDPINFDESSTINNEWFALRPGTRFVWEGTAVDEEGDEEPHRVVFTVTDLTKVIDGVRAIVCWDMDYVDDELVETELAFFAQDKDGTVWHLGEY